MRYQLLALLVLTGLGGAALGHLWTERAPPPAGDGSSSPTPGTATALSGAPSLAGSRRRALPAGGEPSSPGPDAGVGEPDYEGLFGKIEAFESGLVSGAEPLRAPDATVRRQRGWIAFATLYALAGRRVELEDAAGQALAAGVEQGEILAVYCLLPEALVRDGGWVAAIDALRARYPQTAWDPELLASYAQGLEEGPWAFETLARAVGACTAPDARLAKALVACDPRRAAPLLQAKLQKEGWFTDKDLVKALAKAFGEAGEPHVGRPFLQWALTADPADNDLLNLLGVLDPAAALEHARLRVGQDPDDIFAWDWIATAHLAAGARGAAALALREVAERQPSAKNLLRLIEADHALGVLVAETAAAGSQDDELVGVLAHGYFVVGEAEAAWEAYEKAVRLDPQDYQWLLALLDIDPDHAARTLAPQASAEGVGDEIVGTYGSALLATGRPKEAFARFQQALGMDSTDPEWLLGLVLADAERALPILKVTLAEEPASALVRAAHAAALVRLGKRAEGIRILEEIVAAEPGRYTFRIYAQAAPEQALQALQRAVRDEPDKAEWWGSMADLQAQQQNVAEARRLYGRALALEPASPLWRRRLNLLE